MAMASKQSLFSITGAVFLLPLSAYTAVTLDTKPVNNKELTIVMITGTRILYFIMCILSDRIREGFPLGYALSGFSDCKKNDRGR